MSDIQIYDDLTPDLDRIAGQLRDKAALMEILGTELRNTLRAHFYGRGGTFWPRIADATQLVEHDETSATVAVGHPYGARLIHKIDGGTILPKTGGRLAIPAEGSPAGKGVWPRMVSSPALVFAYAPHPDGGDRPALVVRDNYQRALKTGKRKGALVKAGGKPATHGAGTVWFWLIRRAVQGPDLEALPEDDAVVEALRDRGDEYLASVLSGESARNSQN